VQAVEHDDVGEDGMVVTSRSVALEGASVLAARRSSVPLTSRFRVRELVLLRGQRLDAVGVARIVAAKTTCPEASRSGVL